MDPNDPDVIALTKAIFQHESGMNYNATGDAGTSHGAGQWQPETWKAQAHDVLGDPNAPMTPENQKAVAQVSIAKDKAAGLNPAQIAAKWNSGSPQGWENKIGTTTINGQQIKYNVPAYVKSVTDLYQQYKNQNGSGVNSLIQSQGQPQSTAGGLMQSQDDSSKLDQQIQQLTTQSKSQNANPGFFQGLSEDLSGTNPQSIGTQLENTAKGVGNFLFPSVGDVYHDLKGDNTKTGLQQLGDAGSTALSAATLIPGVGEVAAPLKATLGAGKAAEIGGEAASKAAPGLLAQIGKNAALGGAYGVTGAVGSGETDPTKIAESTALGATTGGALGAAGGLLGAKVADTAAGTAEGRLTAQTNRLKTLMKAFNDNSRPATGLVGATDPIQTLKQNNLMKGLKVIGGKVDATALTNAQDTGTIDNLIETHSSDASDLVKSMKGSVPTKDAEDTVLKQVAENPSIRDVGGVSKAQAEVKRIFADYRNSFGEELPYTAIDGIRAGMNRVYDPAERDVARTIGDTMRTYLYNGDGANTALKSTMQNEAELIRARNFVEKLHGTTVPGGQLGKYFADLIGAGIGEGLGSAVGGPIGGAIGTGIGGAATHKIGGMIQGQYFNPIAAKGAGALQKAASSGLSKVIGGTAKAGLLRAAGSAVR